MQLVKRSCCIRMGSKSNMTAYATGDTQETQEEVYVKMEAEIALMQQ